MTTNFTIDDDLLHGYRYKKAGVLLLDLIVASRVQAALFDRPDDVRSLARMRAVDGLNLRFGRDTVSFGVIGRRKWKVRRDLLSPCYTTNWDELLQVS